MQYKKRKNPLNWRFKQKIDVIIVQIEYLLRDKNIV